MTQEPTNDEMPELPPMVRSAALVPPSLPPSGRLPVSSLEEFRALWERSVADVGAYWREVAGELEWIDGFAGAPSLEGSLAEGFTFFRGARMNVSVNCVDRHARREPDRVAIHWIGEDGTERSWTWAELAEQTSRMAAALRGLGVGKGDVVAIFLPNLLETFAAVHACYRIGAIYNIIFSGFSAQALYDRIVDARAKVVITADATLRRGRQIPLKATLDSILERVPSIEHVVVVRRLGLEAPMLPGRDHSWDELLAAHPEGTAPEPIEANEPGFIIYTSGTTAKPKGLVHAGAGFLIGSYHNVRWALDLGPEDVYWCTADTGWLTFPIFELVGGLAHGATMLAYEGALDYPEPDRAYTIIERYHVTKLFTAPTFLRMLARAGASWAERHDLSSLRLISLVGEPLDATTWHWVREHVGGGNVEINNTYGQSETGSAWTSSAVGITPAKPGSCGYALPGHRFDVVDDLGESIGRDRVGYLLLTAPFPTLARSIWGDPERYRTQYFTRFGANRYDTADAALLDDDDHLWVVGRVDGVINVAGHRLSTMEMESALLLVPGVAEAAVIGVPDPVKGQVPVAFVTLAQHAEPLAPGELARAVEREIGPIARPKEVYVLSTMPRTRSGKIVRRLLGELVTQGRASGDVTGLEDPEVLERIAEELRAAGAAGTAG